MITSKYLFLLTLITIPLLAFSDPIFHEKDEKGKFIYTNRGTDSTPAKLPTIARYDSKKVRIDIPETCSKHGGIDCRKGGDTDGSIICKDGFRNVDHMYLDACIETRLELLSLSGPENDIYEVHLRNLRDMEAIKPSVRLFFTPSEPLELESPSNIPAYGTIWIKFRVNPGKLGSKLEKSDLWITCENCE